MISFFNRKKNNIDRGLDQGMIEFSEDLNKALEAAFKEHDIESIMKFLEYLIPCVSDPVSVSIRNCCAEHDFIRMALKISEIHSGY